VPLCGAGEVGLEVVLHPAAKSEIVPIAEPSVIRENRLVKSYFSSGDSMIPSNSTDFPYGTLA
jgi:hypothetical protein